MADIGEFALQAARRVLRGSFMGGIDIGLTEAMVEEFVKAAFYASMIPDEGRYPSVCLMSYRSESAIYFHTQFADPLESTADTIAKLAHAIDNHSHIACICSDNKIKLGGFHVNMISTKRELGFGWGRVGNPLKVTLRRPGNINVSMGGHSVNYRGGEISEERPLLNSKAMKRLVGRVENELRRTRDGLIASLDIILVELVGAIVRLGHGGIVIFAETPKASQFSSHRRTNCLYFGQLLEDYWDRFGELVAAAGGSAALLTSGSQAQYGAQKLHLASATDRLENCLQAIANLSGLDGAIVLTYGCNVGAFNAIIDRQTSSEMDTRLVDEHGAAIDYQHTFAGRGSRHQSALLYARRVPDSVVFVISQDGSISAFHNPNDGTVVCEFGMRPIA